jgi:hypothetical protein
MQVRRLLDACHRILLRQEIRVPTTLSPAWTIPKRQILGQHAAPGHLARHLARPKQESARGLSRHMCHAPLRHLARHLARHLGNRSNRPPDMAKLCNVGCLAGQGPQAAGGRESKPGSPPRTERTPPETSAHGLLRRSLRRLGTSATPSADARDADAACRTPPSSPVHQPDTRPWDVARHAGTLAAEGPDGHEPSLAQVPCGA